METPLPVSQYLAKLPNFLASSLWDVLVGMQFADAAWKSKDGRAEGGGPQGYNKSGKVRFYRSLADHGVPPSGHVRKIFFVFAAAAVGAIGGVYRHSS